MFYADADFGFSFELLHCVENLRIFVWSSYLYYFTNCIMAHHFIGISAEFYGLSHKKHNGNVIPH